MLMLILGCGLPEGMTLRELRALQARWEEEQAEQAEEQAEQADTGAGDCEVYSFPADDGAHAAEREGWSWLLSVEDEVGAYLIRASVERGPQGDGALGHAQILRLSDGRTWEALADPAIGGEPGGLTADGAVSAQGAEGRSVLQLALAAADGEAAGASLALLDPDPPMAWAGGSDPEERGYARSRAEVVGELSFGPEPLRRRVEGLGWEIHRWGAAGYGWEGAIQERLWLRLEDGREIRVELPPVDGDSEARAEGVRAVAQIRDGDGCATREEIVTVRAPESGPFPDNASGCAWAEHLEVEIGEDWLRVRPLWYRTEQRLDRAWALDSPATVSGDQGGGAIYSARCGAWGGGGF